MNVCENNMYLSARIDNLDILAQTREEHPMQEDAGRTVEAAPGRVGRDEQGRAHRANTTGSGLYFELGRLRLKSWSKSVFSIADAPWPTNLCKRLLTFRLAQSRCESNADSAREVAATFLLRAREALLWPQQPS